MKEFISQIQIRVNENIFLKDPNTSELGKRIVSQGITMINEMGLESFTFRKLARELETTESSIYRYFESKHKFLIYIISWYWCWLEYQLVFSITNIASPVDRLKVAIDVIAMEANGKEIQENIDLSALNQIVISESSKAYLTKEVDDANKLGFYVGYKRVVNRISSIIQEINSGFEYANTLVSTIVEGIHHQKYFADHLPSLTDIRHDSAKLAEFYSEMALNFIQNGKENGK
jgi:AcrR family transcriptional regulator